MLPNFTNSLAFASIGASSDVFDTAFRPAASWLAAGISEVDKAATANSGMLRFLAGALVDVTPNFLAAI